MGTRAPYVVHKSCCLKSLREQTNGKLAGLRLCAPLVCKGPKITSMTATSAWWTKHNHIGLKKSIWHYPDLHSAWQPV